MKHQLRHNKHHLLNMGGSFRSFEVAPIKEGFNFGGNWIDPKQIFYTTKVSIQ